jgi:hypothetical protein
MYVIYLLYLYVNKYIMQTVKKCMISYVTYKRKVSWSN